MLSELAEAVRAKQVVLFVGAGVSMNLGLPSWRALIAEMAKELNYDPEVFEQQGTYLELAEYYLIKKSTMGPLRSWMDRTWHPAEQRVEESAIHQRIVDLKCPIIYTTNYDRWLEIAYAKRGIPFTRIASVGDFPKIRDGITQIVKFHGDFDDDESLILTESSYFDRLDFESPLDIKLRADSLGKNLFFIGYRLSDVNIRLLFYKLHKLWAASPFAAMRPRSYIFLTRPNPVQEAILAGWGITSVVSESDDPAAGLQTLLTSLVSAGLG